MRLPTSFCLIVAIGILSLNGLVGCSTTTQQQVALGRPKVPPSIRTTTTIGDRPVTIVAGTPGGAAMVDTDGADRGRVASSSEGRVSGRVLDESGRPVPGAEVRLADGSVPYGPEIRAVADDSGGFTLRGLRPGRRYVLVAESNDDQGRSTLRARESVEAPDSDVRLLLVSDAPEPGGARRRVDRASGVREARPYDLDDEPEPTTPQRPLRINPEDLPPADEAAPRRSGQASLAARRTSQGPGWQSAVPGGVGIEADPEPRESDRASIFEADEPERFERRTPSPRRLSPLGLPIDEEDGPDPLPPALERRGASGPDPADDFAPPTYRRLDADGLSFESLDDEPEPEPQPAPRTRPRPEPESESDGFGPRARPIDDFDPPARRDPLDDDFPPARRDPLDDGFPPARPRPSATPGAILPAPSAEVEPDGFAPAPTPTPADAPRGTVQDQFRYDPADLPAPPADLDDFDLPAAAPAPAPAPARPSGGPTQPPAADFPEPAPVEAPTPSATAPAGAFPEPVPPAGLPQPGSDDLADFPPPAPVEAPSPAPASGSDDLADFPPPATQPTDEGSGAEVPEPPSLLLPPADEPPAGSTEPKAEPPAGLDPAVEPPPALDAPPSPVGPAPTDSADEPDPTDDADFIAGPEADTSPDLGRAPETEDADEGIIEDAPPLSDEATFDPAARPTWSELTSQSAERKASQFAASTRRIGPASAEKPGVKPASERGASSPARGLGLLGLSRRRTAEADPEGTGSAPAPASCKFDARANRLVEFELPDLEGRPVRFSDFDSDLILIDFWGSWCGPCMDSIPHLARLQNRFDPARVQVVGIAYERGEPAENLAAVRRVIREKAMSYPVLMGSENCPLAAALHVQAYPTMILVDRQGTILWRGTGATPETLARLDRVIAAQSRNARTASAAAPATTRR